MIKKMLDTLTKREIAELVMTCRRKIKRYKNLLLAAEADAGRLAEMCSAIVEDPELKDSRFRIGAEIALARHRERLGRS